MADPAVFDPQIVHAQKLFAETLSPEKVRVSLESAHDVVVVDFRENPFLFAPYAGAVGPGGLAHARVEEGAPVLAVVALEGLDVVADVEEAAGLGAVDDLVEGVGFGGGRVGVEGDVFGGEAVVVGDIVAAGLVADVLVSGAAVFGDVGGFDGEVGWFGFGNEGFGFEGERGRRLKQ